MPKLSLRLGFSITLSTCLLGSMPLVVYAGKINIPGGNDSSQFVSSPQVTSVLASDAQGLNLDPYGYGGVESVSVETADKVTIIVREIQNNSETFIVIVDGQPIKLPADIIGQVLGAMGARGNDPDLAAALEDRIIAAIQTADPNVSPGTIASITSNISTLITKLRGIFQNVVSSKPVGGKVARTPGLVNKGSSSTKGSMDNQISTSLRRALAKRPHSPLPSLPITYDHTLNLTSSQIYAQTDLIPVKNLEIDPNQLNDAILAYNKVILEADEEGLIALSNTPEFLAIGEIMRQFRAAFATSAGGEDGEGG